MKEIRNYEGLYEINVHGDIRSKDRLIRLATGSVRYSQGKPIKAKENNDGYLFVTLSKNGEAKNYYVHRLVAETFIANPNNKPQVNHLDGNKKNNNLYNLEWSTPAENTKHAYNSGLSKNIGATHSFAKKLTDRCTGKIYNCIKEAAVELEINYTTLRNMLCGSNKNKTCLEYYSEG